MDASRTEQGRFQHILVGVDGTPSSLRALRWAISLAEVTGSKVTAVMGWLPNINYAYPDVPYVRRSAEQAFTEAVAAIDPGSVALQVVFAQRDAAGMLVEASAKADLLVVGTRRHHGLVGMVLGSVSAQVLPHAHCPVVVVPEAATETVDLTVPAAQPEPAIHG
jgi:nucleotide-binding universal stress UspA family protein